MSNNIHLTWTEVMISAQKGIIQRLSSIDQGLNCNNATNISGWDTDISGAIAEYAFAKYAKIFWELNINTFKKPDVGNIQVRSTKHANGHLLLKRNDPDHDPYVLICGAYHDWTVIGWMRGQDAKQEKYWREATEKKSSCFWIPQQDLEPIETLIERNLQ